MSFSAPMALDQTLNERVGAPMAGAYLGENRHGDQERAVEPLFK